MAPDPANSYEMADDESQVPVRFAWQKKTLPDGTQVEPGTRISVHFGSGENWQTVPLDETGRGEFSTNVDMPDGAAFEFKYLIEKPDGTQLWFPAGGPETNLKGAAKAAAESTSATSTESASPKSKAPSPTDIQRDIPKLVERILSGSFSEKSAEKIDVTLRALYRELGRNGEIKEDVLYPVVLKAFSGFIRSERRVPSVMKRLFKKEDEPASFDEVSERITLGMSAYREQVFDQIQGNDAACKALGIDSSTEFDEADPFGDSELNEAFFTETAVRCLGGVTPRLRRAFDRMVSSPSADPDVVQEMSDLRTEIVQALPKEKQENLAMQLLGKVKSTKLAGAADIAMNLSLYAIDSASSWWKGLLEGVSGVSTKDVVSLVRDREVMKFLKKLLANNILLQPVLSKRSYLSALGYRLAETAGRSIPLANLYFTGAGVGERMPFGEGKSESPEKEVKKEKKTTPHQYIINACNSAL